MSEVVSDEVSDAYTERLRSHAATERLSALPDEVAQAHAEEEREDARASLSRAEYVSGHLLQVLESSDARLITTGYLDRVQKACTELRRALAPSAQQRRSVAAIDKATDSLAARLREALPLALGDGDVAMEVDVPRLERLVAKVDADSRELSGQLKNLQQAIAAAESDIDEAVHSARTRMDAQASRVDEVVQSIQTEARSARDEATDALSTLEAEKRRALEEQLAEMDSAAERLMESLQQQVTTELDRLAEQRDKAERIYRSAIGAGMAGAFARDAQRHFRLSLAWAIVAVVVGVSVAGGGIWALLQGAVEGWSEAIQVSTRLLVVAAALGGVAAFAGRQAKDHRYHERVDREVALKLETIDAFCEGFEDEDAVAELRREFGSRLFREPLRLSVGDLPHENSDAAPRG